MKKKVVLYPLAMAVALSLTGCDNAEVQELNSISALNSEATVTTVSMSATDKEAAVYAQVSDRTLLDLTALESVNASDEQAVIAYMESVDTQLTGSLAASSGVIDECYTNYLLMEFEKTPYYWQRSSMNIRGMDATSRSIVVDVTYKTLDYKKDVQTSSTITKGEPNYEQKLSVRYSRWLSLLNEKYGYSNLDYEADWNKFISVYGEPSSIIAAQRDESLTTYINEKGNQKTYTGLVDSDEEQSGGTMTVRYVLVPTYTLGINQGLNCKHMYVVNYKLDEDPTSTKEVYAEEGTAPIADTIYNHLYSYYQCKDESNYSGLYSLTHGFDNLDKHFEDYFDTTYRKHENFTITLFDISGTKIECGVTLSRKIRAKGSNMTMPIYTDRIYYTMELIDGELKITNEVLISSELEGEPVINTTEVDTTGFTSSISLSNSDKQSLENLIANFGVVQLLQDTTSDNFSDSVDNSISTSQVASIKEQMTSVSGDKKVTWIISYLQGQSNYASIKCRELFQKEDNSIYECVVTYDFINKGGSWYIYNYLVNSAVRLDTTDLSTKNALCVVSKSGVDVLNSQLVSTSNGSSDNAMNTVGTVIDYQAYKPSNKTSVQSNGLKTKKASDATDADVYALIDKIYAMSSSKYTREQFYDAYDCASMNIKTCWLEMEAEYQNYTAGYIEEAVHKKTMKSIQNSLKTYAVSYDIDIVSDYASGLVSQDVFDRLDEMSKIAPDVALTVCNLLP